MRSFLYVLKLWAYRHCVATQVVLVGNIVNGSLDKSDFQPLRINWVSLGHSDTQKTSIYSSQIISCSSLKKKAKIK